MTVYSDLQPFFEEMLGIMRSHDAEKGDSWRGPQPYVSFALRNKLWEEFREIIENEDLEDSENLHELVDLANICAMIWLRGLDKVKNQSSASTLSEEAVD